MNETVASRPMPKRPEYGLLAWEATIGYLHAQYKLDAVLTLHIDGLDDKTGWAAEADWGNNHEAVEPRVSLPQVLGDLWVQVASRHVIFETKEALIKRPANYSENEWVDSETQEVLEHLVRTTAAIFPPGWRITLVYRPVESPALRWRAQLKADTLQVAEQNVTLRDACRGLYRRAAPEFAARSGRHFDEKV
jgi:hypothetical protein